MTPLGFAIEMGDYEMTELLISKARTQGSFICSNSFRRGRIWSPSLQ